MNNVTIPTKPVLDKELSKNSLRLYIYAVMLKAAGQRFTLIKGLSDLEMSQQTYTNARAALLAHGYFKPRKKEHYHEVNWELNEAVLETMDR